MNKKFTSKPTRIWLHLNLIPCKFLNQLMIKTCTALIQHAWFVNGSENFTNDLMVDFENFANNTYVTFREKLFLDFLECKLFLILVMLFEVILMEAILQRLCQSFLKL